MNVDLQILPGLAGMALSLAASFPGIKPAYDRLTPGGKQVVMGLLIIAVGICSALWECSAHGTCGDVAMWRALASGLFFTLVGNTATHQATKHLKRNRRSDQSIPIIGAIRPARKLP